MANTNITRAGVDISIKRKDGMCLENSAVFTMTSEDKVETEFTIGYALAQQESDLDTIKIILESMIMDSINKPGIAYGKDESDVIIRLINMTDNYFNHIKTTHGIHIFTNTRKIGEFNGFEVFIELIIQLVRDTKNTLVITMNIYTKK